MKAFWLAMIAMVVIGVAAAVVLDTLPNSAEENYTTSNVRLD